MADLKFDCEAFATAIADYKSVAESLRQTKDDLVAKMDNLKACWQSDAGTAFDSFYNDNWVSHVDLYVTVLEQLAELLQKACDEYQTLEEKIPKIYSE